MSATFYELLKYAKTGIAAPEMTHYDKLKALAMCKAGFPVKTISGIPPISFKSDGTQLTAWSISGNMVQTGTPTPSAPIMPEETGDKTANLWANFKNHSNYGVTITKHDDGLYFSGTGTQNGNFTVYGSLKAGAYTIAANANRVPVNANTVCIQIYKADVVSKYVTNANAVSGYTTFEIGEDIDDVQFRIRVEVGINYDGFILRPMLNSGSTALPFEPYGYKLPLTLAGQTQTVYLDEPLRKIGDYADKIEASGATGTVTRRIKKLVLTGQEELNQTGGDDNPRFYTFLSDTVANSACFCSHFVDGQASLNGACDIAASKNLIINNSGLAFNVADFKTYLSTQYQNGTPVTVWYVLVTPTTETATVPTLTPQKGSNTLSIGTTLQPSEVSITGHIKAS